MIIEQNTNYAYKLKYTGSPSFEKIRGLSSKFFLELPKELQDQLHEALNRGVDELDSEPLMVAYLFSFGKMHQAKLNYAFKHLPEECLVQPEINIIDYGCGQALGAMCYADFLRENGYTQKVKTITLIEPSEICMKRAALHASAFFPDAEIKTVNKKFDDLTQDDIVCNEETPTLHVLSNVLDMLNFNLERFAELVKGCLKGYNQFVCVGPYFGKNDRSKRMDDFANNLMEGIIYTVDLNSFELDPNYSWTCMVRCFGVGNLGIALHKEKAGTVNSNVKPSFTNFMSFKGQRKVFIGVKSIINPETNQKESWQELILGESKDDPNAEIIRISSKLGTINANFLILNKDNLQVASHPDWKYKRLCIEDRPESTLRENLSTEVTEEDIENGIIDEFGVIYSINGKRLLIAHYCDFKTFTIKKRVKVICDEAFYSCKSLQSIVIPNSVTSIGKKAFLWCTSLQSIVIPNSVTSIGKGAFLHCTSLQSIAIPNSVKSIEKKAFFDCKSLQSIVIPNSVKSIGEQTFNGCTALQSIVIPESVTSIGNHAFSHCASFQSIVIPESLTSIGELAFYQCTSLQSMVIPDSVITIGNGAFSHCASLQSIVIPNSVTGIGKMAFNGCDSLRAIIIPSGSRKKFEKLLPNDIDKLVEK